MEEKKCYLAGKMSGLSYDEMNEWRIKLIPKLKEIATVKECKIKIINPIDYYNFKNPTHKREEEVEDFDLQQVLSSQLMVIKLKGFDTSPGTIIEYCKGSMKNDLVILGLGTKEEEKNLHPWLKRYIRRIENDEDKLCEYIRDYVLI